MVAGAVRAALTEAKKKGGRKPNAVQARTEKWDELRREKQVRATGYMHSDPGDFAEPLEDESLYKRQGASGIGGWTGESREQLMKLVEMVVREELQVIIKG